MAEKWVCMYCIAEKGIKGRDLKNWPDVDDEEGIARHIESEHHVPVNRDGETEAQTMERFAREQPEAGGPNCKCPSCHRTNATATVDAVMAAKRLGRL